MRRNKKLAEILNRDTKPLAFDYVAIVRNKV